MSRIALISDVHGNVEALRGVLEDICAAGVPAVYCLGDVVGYGPDPGPAVELVCEACVGAVLGNHDEAVLALRPDCPSSYAARRTLSTFNTQAAEAIRYTAAALEGVHVRVLRGWAEHLRVDGVELRHANLAPASGPSRWEYLLTVEAAVRSFSHMSTFIAGVGHTHVPGFICSPMGVAASDETVRSWTAIGSMRATLPGGCRTIVNPGSVGQPRDGNPEASWGLLDTQSGVFEVRRVAYDVEAVDWKMRRLGLPLPLVRRLRLGA